MTPPHPVPEPPERPILAGRLAHTGVRTLRAARPSPLTRSFTILCGITSLILIYHDWTGWDSLFKIGGYTVATAEPMLVFLAVTILLALAEGSRIVRPIVIACLGLTGVICLAILRGVLVDSFAALFSARALLCTPLFMVLGAVIAERPALIGRAVRTIQITAMLLALLVASRILFHAPMSEAFAADGRPLLNYGALCIGIGAALYISDGIRRKRGKDLRNGLALLLVCLLTRQATATLASITAIAVVITLESGAARRERFLLALVGGFLALIVRQYADQLLSLMNSDRDIASYLSNRTDTNDTRQEVWQAFLDQFAKRDLLDKLIGLPMGQHEDIYIERWGGVYWSNTLHSMYFETLQSIGFVGLSAYLLVLGLALLMLTGRHSLARPGEGPISPVAGLALTVGVAIFGYSYDMRGQASLFLMLIVACAIGQAPRHRPGAARAKADRLPPRGIGRRSVA